MWIVTGPSGFIGSHILTRLGAEGVPLSRHSSDRRSVRSWKADHLAEVLKGAEGIIHVGGVVPGVGVNDEDYARGNVEATRELLSAARTSGVDKFLFLSTIKVHGEAPRQVIDELTPLAPETPYAVSKGEAERLVLDARGLQSRVLRLCPVYGRGEKGNVRRLVRAIDRGGFFVPGRGTARKSLVHISTVVDVVEAVTTSSFASGVFVVADEPAPSIRELADVIAEILGRRRPHSVPTLAMRTAAAALRTASPLIPSAGRLGAAVDRAMSDSICDPAKTRRETGIECRSDLVAAVTDEVDWLRDSGHIRS